MVTRHLSVAVPNLAAYTPTTGIGRVLTSLLAHWDDVELIPARFVAPRLPVLRNAPSAVAFDGDADLILFPQLTGAAVLRSRPRAPAVVIVHDLGVVDCPEDRATVDPITLWSVMRSFAALPCAERVVTVSRFTAARVAEYHPSLKERTVVIANAAGDAFHTIAVPVGVLGLALGGVAGGQGFFLLVAGLVIAHGIVNRVHAVRETLPSQRITTGLVWGSTLNLNGTYVAALVAVFTALVPSLRERW